MFNFYVVLAGHDMFADSGRTTTCGCKFKTPSLRTKRVKNEEHFDNMGFNRKQFEDLDEKKIKYKSSLEQTTP